MARVFEPFFTTKGEGKGTGLGLSMVHGFVKQSQGHMPIYSEPGQGTTVKIYLPRTRKAEAVPDKREVLIDGHGETVMVVEDEAAVREAACAMLTELGYHCIQADGPDAALEILRRGDAVDLLFTDVVMPGSMKTPAFVKAARKLRLAMPVLYTSGYTENAIVHHGRLDEGVALLSKPYGKADLARKVAAALVDGRAAVLLVEDEVLVRAAAADMISDLGFVVLQAEDAAGALESSKARRPGRRAVHGHRPARHAWRRPGEAGPGAQARSQGGVGQRLQQEPRTRCRRSTAPSLEKPYDAATLAKALGRI